MIKNLIVSACLLLSIAGLAQEGSSSPYSFYGIGESRFKGTAENRSMAGLMIFPDSIHMNIQNPASYSSLRLTTFTVGGSLSTTKMHTETQDSDARRTTLDYFAVGLPMGKLGVGFGLVPLTSVGYRIQSKEIESNGLETTKSARGTGGVNRAFIGASYEIMPNFRAGLDFAYNFGNVETVSLQRATVVQLGSRETNTSQLSGASFTAGLSYDTKISEKLRLYTGMTYAPESTIKSDNVRQIATIQFLQLGGEQVSGIPFDGPVKATKLKIPSKFTFGAGIGEVRKWSIGAEVALQQSAGQSKTFAPYKNPDDEQTEGEDAVDELPNVHFDNSIRYNFGGYYIPKYNSFSNYFNKITYRAGIRYETTGLVITNKTIEDRALTVGLGLPVPGSFSNINVGVEIGKRGTIYNGLIREDYLNFFVGLSLNDKWFVKRKYD